MNKKARTRLIFATVVIVVALIAGIVYVMSTQAAYYKQVSELVSGDWDGKNVQVGGRGVQVAGGGTYCPGVTSVPGLTWRIPSCPAKGAVITRSDRRARIACL